MQTLHSREQSRLALAGRLKRPGSPEAAETAERGPLVPPLGARWFRISCLAAESERHPAPWPNYVGVQMFGWWGTNYVGRTRLELVTSCVSCKRATRLRQRPSDWIQI